MIFVAGLMVGSQAVAADCLPRAQGVSSATHHRPRHVVRHHPARGGHSAALRRVGARNAHLADRPHAPRVVPVATRVVAKVRHPFLRLQLACDTASASRPMSAMDTALVIPGGEAAASPVGDDASAIARSPATAEPETPAGNLRPLSPESAADPVSEADWRTAGLGWSSGISGFQGSGFGGGIGPSVGQPSEGAVAPATIAPPLPTDPEVVSLVPLDPGLVGQVLHDPGPDTNTPQPPTSLPGGSRSDPIPVAGVPEPSTWAMMLLGFGGIGAMQRHRRHCALREP